MAKQTMNNFYEFMLTMLKQSYGRLYSVQHISLIGKWLSKIWLTYLYVHVDSVEAEIGEQKLNVEYVVAQIEKGE